MGIDADDAQGDNLSLFDHLTRVLDPPVRQLADVDQPFDLRQVDQPGKRAELGELGHRTLNQLIWLVGLVQRIPGVGQAVLAAQADALPVFIDVDHLHLDLVAHAQHLTRMSDVLPGQLREMDQAVGTAQVDKRAKIGQADHLAGDHLPYFKRIDQLGPALLADVLFGGALRQDQPVPSPVDLDHLDGDLVANHVRPALVRRAAIAAPLPVTTDLRSGDKPTYFAEAYDQAALVVALDGAPIGCGAVEVRLCVDPVLLLHRPAQREQDVPIRPFS